MYVYLFYIHDIPEVSEQPLFPSTHTCLPLPYIAPVCVLLLVSFTCMLVSFAHIYVSFAHLFTPSLYSTCVCLFVRLLVITSACASIGVLVCGSVRTYVHAYMDFICICTCKCIYMYEMYICKQMCARVSLH